MKEQEIQGRNFTNSMMIPKHSRIVSADIIQRLEWLASSRIGALNYIHTSYVLGYSCSME